MSNSGEIANIVYSYSINELEEENKLLKETINHLKNEIDRFRTPPLMVCEIKEIDGNNAVIKVPNGNQFFVCVSESCDPLRAGDSVLVDQKNLNVLRKYSKNKSFSVEKFVILEKPTVTFKNIGGLEKQILEIKEVVELPLTKPYLFKKVGITPPKGILLYGPPGTGKTLLGKAVANSTDSTFIEVVASELVQKFIGEGAKLVKEIFELAREKAPSIIFIDEIDALAAKRLDVGTSGEREVQRTFMQLLAEIDGFEPLGNVKVIGCTNRRDILDPAILRPGRLDRLVHVPLPDKQGLGEIFKIHTKDMSFDHIKVDKLLNLMDGFSGAEVRAACTEAGYFAIRDDRSDVTEKDFIKAIDKVSEEEDSEDEYVNMFG
ncbi:MAG: AAA family ATPase [Candidatus Woesearchaeota archaeon]|nr:AAA family ATPase [Candidatus Woesearchaeota archaeon]